MNIETLNSWLSWLAIMLTVLATFASAGSLITGNIIGNRKDQQIEKLKPRSLTNVQRAALSERLRSGHGQIGFVSRLMDGEGADFSETLASTFRDSGWTVVPPIRTSLNDFSGFVSLFVTGENLQNTAQIVSEALNAAGILCKFMNIDESTIGGVRSPDTVYVVIGRK